MFGDNTDIEGVDVKNACFGGTQALFHAIDWIYANWATEGTINFLLPVLIFKTSLIDDIPMFLSLNSILNNKVHEECIRLHHVNRLVFYIWFLKIILTFCISFFFAKCEFFPRISERYAIVVMGDIAIYEAGPARCTGGKSWN